ncbi:MAG TPA: hypothetical protein VEL51_01805 [Vicinamibacterales bacterium]|nr:hypothetical protein [Vicinamibacterales bacterium]
MTAHLLTHEGERRDPTRRARNQRLINLGWSEYWLLTAILGGMLALLGFVLLVLR